MKIEQFHLILSIDGLVHGGVVDCSALVCLGVHIPPQSDHISPLIILHQLYVASPDLLQRAHTPGACRVGQHCSHSVLKLFWRSRLERMNILKKVSF